jgi:hypothetical protein
LVLTRRGLSASSRTFWAGNISSSRRVTAFRQPQGHSLGVLYRHPHYRCARVVGEGDSGIIRVVAVLRWLKKKNANCRYEVRGKLRCPWHLRLGSGYHDGSWPLTRSRIFGRWAAGAMLPALGREIGNSVRDRNGNWCTTLHHISARSRRDSNVIYSTSITKILHCRGKTAPSSSYHSLRR